MEKILISIEEKQQKILQNLSEKGFNRSKMIRNLINLLDNVTEDTTFVAFSDENICVVKDCGNTVANTFTGAVDTLNLVFKYSDGKVEEEKFECKINIK